MKMKFQKEDIRRECVAQARWQFQSALHRRGEWISHGELKRPMSVNRKLKEQRELKAGIFGMEKNTNVFKNENTS